MSKKRFSHSIILRFVSIFIFLGVVPLILLMAWAIYSSNESMIRHLKDNVFELIKQKAEYTSLQLSTVENLMNNISNVEDVIVSLKEESDTQTIYQTLKIQANIGYVLAGYVNIEGIESIDIFSHNLNRYHFGKSLIKNDETPSDVFLEVLEENSSSGADVHWHGIHKNINNPESYSLIASKKLSYLDITTKKEIYIGIIVVHYSLANISENFSGDFSKKFSSFIVDNNFKIIYAPDEKLIGSDFKSINEISKERLHNFDKINYAGNDALLLKYNLDNYGLKFFTFISNKYLWQTQFDSLRISLIGLISIVIFSLIIFYIFAKRILFPIKELTEAFVDITKNRYDLNSQIEITTIDEIGELQMWFNSFVKNMQEKNKNAVELKKQKEMAEIANLAKDNFLASISHEIRTPLNGVISVSEILSHTQLNTEQEEYVEVIQQSSDILYSLINQVLDFSKISMNKLLLTPDNFDLIQLLNKMANLYSVQAKVKKLRFEYKKLPYDKLYVYNDEIALQKILINLLGNSLKYTITGKITLSIEEISKDEENIKLRISVSDTGLGIPDAKKKIIFEAFEQVDGSLSKKISGTGLGLSIAQQLSYLMQSEINLISPNPDISYNAEYPGSVFYLEINLSLGQDTLDYNQKDLDINPKDFDQIKCLVIEDNLINQKVIKAILSNLGLSVDIASNWRESLNFINKNLYSYIFMDIQMPEVTGLELTKIFRDKGVKTPIIAVSGNVIDEVREQAMKAGMDDFIVKPIKSSEIKRVLLKFKE